jgi:hypothetical protein
MNYYISLLDAYEKMGVVLVLTTPIAPIVPNHIVPEVRAYCLFLGIAKWIVKRIWK